MKKIAILHTAIATVPMFMKLIGNRYPDVVIYNWLDDSILPMLMEDDQSLTYAFEKMLTYAKYAEKQGAELILNACSSVGEFKNYAANKLSVPLIRIDDPVTDILASTYSKVAVLATLETTLRPSTALLKSKGVDLEVDPRVVDGAYAAAAGGDKAKHDKLIAAAVKNVLSSHEAVFLAQASMSEAMAYVPDEMQDSVYTSTKYVIECLNQYLE